MAGAPRLFDRALAAQRAARASRAEPSILARTLAAELTARLALVRRRFRRVCLIATEPAAIAAELTAGGQVDEVEQRLPAAEDDLKLTAERHDAVFSVLDLHIVNDVPGALIPVLQIAQAIFGYLPDAALRRISVALGKSYSEVAGVVGFYSFFTTVPRGRHIIRVCLGTACYVRGGKDVLAALRTALRMCVCWKHRASMRLIRRR